ncbi:MAG: hypothetical protein HY842_00135 [Bacteroidetes bacterium]|nr:hypothetical protein [Bacteroidota bacterium]
MKQNILLFFALLLLGCGEKKTDTQTATLTDYQKKAHEAIATAFGGKVAQSLSPDKQTLELALSDCILLEQESDLLALHSSRAAWIYYQNTAIENPKYTGINVSTVLKDTTKTFHFTLAQLGILQTKISTIDMAAKFLITDDYTNLHALFDPVVMASSTEDDLRGYCAQVEPEYGKPVSFEFQGFSFFKLSSGQEQLDLAGKLKRSKKDTPLGIFVDFSKPGIAGSVTSIKFDY